MKEIGNGSWIMVHKPCPTLPSPNAEPSLRYGAEFGEGGKHRLEVKLRIPNWG
jgi:hypothetical protein